MHTMRVMTKDGDRTVRWDPAKRKEVATAEKEFSQLMGTGSFLAYMIAEANASPVLIGSFHPEAETIVIAPKLAGG